MRNIICVATCDTTSCPFNSAHDDKAVAADQGPCTVPAEVLWRMLVAVVAIKPAAVAAPAA